MERIDVNEILGGIAPTGEAPPAKRPCGAQWLNDDRNLSSGVTYCDGVAHYALQGGARVVTGRCRELKRAEVRARIEAEAERLAGVLEEVGRLTGLGFDGFIRNRHPKVDQAWRAMRDFASGRPPTRGVFLSGSTGLGKTRLLLASHFELLAAGVDSEYVSAAQLRELFHEAENFDAEISRPAKDRIAQLARAEALHLDDLGDVEGDQRKRGTFAGGLKGMLDQRRGAWAAATNLSSEAADAHPELGEKILSRLVANATVVKLEGADFRVEFGR
jgi:DNA replication protein DnaC